VLARKGLRVHAGLQVDAMRKLVSERFPSLTGKMAGLLESDETLRELCEDLEACEEAAARLEGPEGGSAELRREYAALGLRLERELLQHLEESGAMTTENEGASAPPTNKKGKGGVHRA
jgi:hypothetical protein